MFDNVKNSPTFIKRHSMPTVCQQAPHVQNWPVDHRLGMCCPASHRVHVNIVSLPAGRFLVQLLRCSTTIFSNQSWISSRDETGLLTSDVSFFGLQLLQLFSRKLQLCFTVTDLHHRAVNCPFKSFCNVSDMFLQNKSVMKLLSRSSASSTCRRALMFRLWIKKWRMI